MKSKDIGDISERQAKFSSGGFRIYMQRRKGSEKARSISVEKSM